MSRRIKILHLIGQLAPGGMENVVAQLVMHLDPERFEVHLWSLGSGDELVARLTESGIVVRELDKGLGFSLTFLRRLRSLLRQERFDIVHAHNTPAARWAFLSALAVPGRPRLVRTAHTYDPAHDTAARFDHAVTGGMFDAVIGVSDITCQAHRKLDPLWKGRYHSIPNGIDVSHAVSTPDVDCRLRDSMGIDRQCRVLANIGNLRPAKDHETLLNAMKIVVQRHPDSKLVIFGEGPLRPWIERQVDSLALNEHVVLAGLRDDARDLLALADLYVQSSVREGMPISILEAMCACRPIVATDAGGTQELVRNDETGLLVPPGEAEPLAVALLDLLENDERSRSLALAARRLLLDRYDIRSVANRTERLYESILRGTTG